MTNHRANDHIEKIVYSFKDAAIPPQYHRSYTITVTRHQVHILVDSYGDVLADASRDIPAQTVDDLAKLIEQYQIKETEPSDDTSMCVGGTSKSLTVYSDKDILLDGTVYPCGNRLAGSLSGDLDAFAEEMEALIPDFATLLK